MNTSIDLKEFNLQNLKGLNTSTYLIKYDFTNYDNSKKSMFVFVDGSDNWFDHFFKGTDNNPLSVGGGKYGRLEQIHSSLRTLFDEDKSIYKQKSEIYDIRNFKEPLMDFCEKVK